MSANLSLCDIFVLKAKNRERKPRKSMNLLTYIKKETVISTVKGLNLKINKEPAHLTISYPTGQRNSGERNRNHYWDAKELIGRCILNIFRKRPVRSRMQGVVGAGG